MEIETQDYILNLLRRGTIEWRGRSECINRGRRKKKIVDERGYNREVFENNCEGPCGEWFELRKNPFEVDHIEAIGPFKGSFDDFIKRMYCDQSNLQRLCHSCHARKTAVFNAALRFERRSEKNKKPTVYDL